MSVESALGRPFECFSGRDPGSARATDMEVPATKRREEAAIGEGRAAPGWTRAFELQSPGSRPG